MILLPTEKIDEQYLGISTTNRNANYTENFSYHTPTAYHYGRLEFILWDNLKSSSWDEDDVIDAPAALCCKVI